MSTSWRRLRRGRVCPRLQMSCCSLESNITWIQVACPLLLIGPVVGDYRGSTCLNHRGGGWPSRVAESWNWTTPLSLGGQSASQRTRSSGPTLQSVIRRRAQSSQCAVIAHHLLHLSHLLSYLQIFVIPTHFLLAHCNAAQPC